jgi:hypothetical protein
MLFRINCMAWVEGMGNQQPLLHAAGIRLYPAPGGIVQTNQFQQFVGAALGLRIQVGEDPQVIATTESPIEVLILKDEIDLRLDSVEVG